MTYKFSFLGFGLFLFVAERPTAPGDRILSPFRCWTKPWRSPGNPPPQKTEYGNDYLVTKIGRAFLRLNEGAKTDQAFTLAVKAGGGAKEEYRKVDFLKGVLSGYVAARAESEPDRIRPGYEPWDDSWGRTMTLRKLWEGGLFSSHPVM